MHPGPFYGRSIFYGTGYGHLGPNLTSGGPYSIIEYGPGVHFTGVHILYDTGPGLQTRVYAPRPATVVCHSPAGMFTFQTNYL